jgi:hypothetical protein
MTDKLANDAEMAPFCARDDNIGRNQVKPVVGIADAFNKWFIYFSNLP